MNVCVREKYVCDFIFSSLAMDCVNVCACVLYIGKSVATLCLAQFIFKCNEHLFRCNRTYISTSTDRQMLSILKKKWP